MGFVKIVSRFAFYYACAWLGWSPLIDYAVRGLRGDVLSVPLLVQIFALSTAIISMCIFSVLLRRPWALKRGVSESVTGSAPIARKWTAARTRDH